MISLANLITFTKDQYTLNVFEAHIKSDTVVFDYTSSDGTKNKFNFSLAGLKEKYLEQFI